MNLISGTNYREKGQSFSRFLKAVYLAFLIQVMVSNWSGAEEFVDVKVMHYQENNDRMRIVAPSFLYKKEFNPDFSIQIDGIYNSISGATPTGAPPVPVYTTRTITEQAPVSAGAPAVSFNDDDDDDDEEEDDDRRRGYNGRAAATPVYTPPAQPSAGPASTGTSQSTTRTTSVPAGTSIPMQNVTDTRIGLNGNVTRRISKSHTLSASAYFSTEDDYRSTGVSLQDNVSMNEKNTIVSFGGAYTYDTIELLSEESSETKKSADALLGLIQYINPKTILYANLVAGNISGYITDQYKVVELNNELVRENRPDSKNKLIGYTGLTKRISSLDGTAETSYRYYTDSFGIDSHTLTFAWFQDIGNSVILRPAVRFYEQSEADFYDIRFTGTPEYYSSDYRVSSMATMSYGLKAVWVISERFRVDAAFDRYEMESSDGKTDAGMYPAANIVTIGGRICF